MIKKIKATISEKLLFFFLIILTIISFTFFYTIKNKCLFIKNYDPSNLTFDEPENIAILNAPCGNVIIKLYPDILEALKFEIEMSGNVFGIIF